MLTVKRSLGHYSLRWFKFSLNREGVWWNTWNPNDRSTYFMPWSVIWRWLIRYGRRAHR